MARDPADRLEALSEREDPYFPRRHPTKQMRQMDYPVDISDNCNLFPISQVRDAEA